MEVLVQAQFAVGVRARVVATAEQYGYVVTVGGPGGSDVDVVAVPAAEAKFDGGGAALSLRDELAPLTLSFDDAVVALALSSSNRFLAVCTRTTIRVVDFHGVVSGKRYDAGAHCVQTLEFQAALGGEPSTFPILTWSRHAPTASGTGDSDRLLVATTDGEAFVVPGGSGGVWRAVDGLCTAFSWSPLPSTSSSSSSAALSADLGAVGRRNELVIVDVAAGATLTSIDNVLGEDGNFEITHVNWFSPDTVFVGGTHADADGESILAAAVVRLSINAASPRASASVLDVTVLDNSSICPPERSDTQILLSSQYIDQWYVVVGTVFPRLLRTSLTFAPSRRFCSWAGVSSSCVHQHPTRCRS